MLHTHHNIHIFRKSSHHIQQDVLFKNHFQIFPIKIRLVRRYLLPVPIYRVETVKYSNHQGVTIDVY